MHLVEFSLTMWHCRRSCSTINKRLNLWISTPIMLLWTLSKSASISISEILECWITSREREIGPLTEAMNLTDYFLFNERGLLTYLPTAEVGLIRQYRRRLIPGVLEPSSENLIYNTNPRIASSVREQSRPCWKTSGCQELFLKLKHGRIMDIP